METGRSPVVVHHHFTSYYSQKLRALLGIKGLSWHSVIQPLIAPRPEYTRLTGGYQRVPVLQIGADLYCDSRLAMTEIERRFPEPRAASGLDQPVNAWVDRYFTPATFAVAIAEIADALEGEFLADRLELFGPAFDLDALKGAAGIMRGQWRAQAAWLDTALATSGGDFLTGPTPVIADAAAAIPFWMFDHREFLAAAMRSPREPCDTPATPVTDRSADPLERLLDGLDGVRAWRDRVTAIGMGRPLPMTAEQALELAAANEPAPAPPHDPHDPAGMTPGELITVIADDSARDPITGTLVSIDVERYVLEWREPSIGAVHVHLPREGYFVSRAG